MLLSHLLTAALFAAGPPPAALTDLDRVSRTLDTEPTYNTRSPKYCLLVFGPEARTLVWLVHDGDAMHALASPDGKSPRRWRQAKGPQYFQIGDVWEDGGKTTYKGLRFSANPRNPRFSVRIDGKIQTAGRDIRGKIQFGPSPEDAPVVHFNGPRTLDLFWDQQPLLSGQHEDLSVVVGTRGRGPGTFTHVHVDAYPRNAWPWAVIEFPVKDGGNPVIAKVRLKDD